MDKEPSTSELLEVIIDFRDFVAKRFDEQDRRSDAHDRRFGEIEMHLDRHDRRFDAHDRRFDEIEMHLDLHDRRFDAHDRRFDAHDRRFDGIDVELATIRAGQAALDARVEVLESR